MAAHHFSEDVLYRPLFVTSKIVFLLLSLKDEFTPGHCFQCVWQPSVFHYTTLKLHTLLRVVGNLTPPWQGGRGSEEEASVPGKHA